MPSDGRGRGGGAASGGGMYHQARVAAWISSRILAETGGSAIWDLPADMRPVFLACETEEPVDDVNVQTSAGGHVLGQAKHGLHAGAAATSELASALDQFVRQFRLGVPDLDHGAPDHRRPMDLARDRLVLIIDSTSSGRLKVQLPQVLSRIREAATHGAQPDPCRTAREQDVYDTVRTHLRRSWEQHRGTAPSEEELLPLLQLMRVQILDFGGGQENDREAADLLQHAVLRNPEQSRSAWSELVQLGEHLIESRSGADRRGLEDRLLNASVRLQVSRSYRDAVERLRRSSQDVALLLEPFTHIQLAECQVRVPRAVSAALRDAAEAGSLVVVGDPGAGKSAELHGLYETLRTAGRDVLLFRSDDLAGASDGIHLLPARTSELLDLLANWPGAEPGFILVDALDAARGSTAARRLRDLFRLILQKAPRWRLVVSIRRYDLQYGTDWKTLFRGRPAAEERFQDPQFPTVQHLNIPLFDDGELAVAAVQSSDLGRLLATASPALHDLLQVPFNLNLAGSLLETGLTVEELSPIRAQIELLERYWERRVLQDDDQADSRDAVVAQVTDAMVQDRSLEAPRSIVAGAASGALRALLSGQVLREWQASPGGPPERYRLLFTHHILFDYAAARRFRGSPRDFIRRLRDDPDLAVTLRPSLALHFEYLWFCRDDPARHEFWNLAIEVVQALGVPALAKIVGPTVAQQVYADGQEIVPLLAALWSETPAIKAAAEVVRHMAAALFAAPEDARRPWVGPSAPPWCYLMAECSGSMSRELVAALWDFYRYLCYRAPEMEPDQLQDAGTAARCFLAFALDCETHDRPVVRLALESVCHTARSDPEASAALLRRCLAPDRVAEWGHEELRALATGLDQLISVLPDLVEELYTITFTHDEKSDEPTPFSSSALQPIRSTRRQDYHLVRAQLAEQFGQFMQADLPRALRALLRALEAYVGEEDERRRVFRRPFAEADPSIDPDPNVTEYPFRFGARTAHIRTDYSSIWDHSRYRIDDVLKMLDAFDDYLKPLCENGERAAEVDLLVDAVVEQNRLAVLWRHLLAVGTAYPDTLGLRLRPLLWAIPTLQSIDTSVAAGELIKVLYPQLAPEDRGRIEEAILSLPASDCGDLKGDRARDRLLGCIPSDQVRTEAARLRLDQLAREQGPPENRPPAEIIEFPPEPYGEREFLAEEGVPVEAPENRKLQLLEAPLGTFSHRYCNETPSPDAVLAISPALLELRAALENAEADGVHPAQQTHAWGELAKAAAILTRKADHSRDLEALVHLRKILLDAAIHPDPEPRPDDEERFNHHPGWGSPAARLDAAAGLMGLARLPTGADEEVLAAIERLSRDPVPAVRFQVASWTNALCESAEPLMWRLLEQFASEESNRGVLSGVIGGPLSILLCRNPDPVFRLIHQIFRRVRTGSGSRNVRQSCAGLLRDPALGLGHSEALDVLASIVADPVAMDEEAAALLAGLRGALVLGPVAPADLTKDTIRRRAWELLERLLCSTLAAFSGRVQSRARGNHLQAEGDTQVLQSLEHLTHAAAVEVWTASGAASELQSGPTGRGGDKDKNGVEELARRERFYRELEPVLSSFVTAASLGHLRATHELVQTLAYLVDVDPARILIHIGDLLRAAAVAGYHYETLGADRVVSFMEQFVADYRDVLRNTPECLSALREILDLFVSPGWGRAVRLTYRLAELYR